MNIYPLKKQYECPHFAKMPCRGQGLPAQKHLRGLVDAFGRIQYAPAWDVCRAKKLF